VPIHVQQILLNLFQNGMHAMEDSPPEQRRLRLIARMHDADFVEVQVIDNGHGFADRDPAKLFEPFVTTKESGLGMGLAIVRSLVQEHGGRVWAENRPRGAAVSFTLPLVPRHESPAAAESHCVCG
jgi:signal transduction histidine kinase